MPFSNRRTPPTDADFACPPGIIPGRRLPDEYYMDEDVAPRPAPDDFSDEFPASKPAPDDFSGEFT